MPLEQRTLLAMVNWDGGGDGRSWLDPLNWSADALPGRGDDVRIGLPAGSGGGGGWGGGGGGGGTVGAGDLEAITFDTRLGGGDRMFIASLRSDRPLVIEKGVLEAEATIELTAGLTVASQGGLESRSGSIRVFGAMAPAGAGLGSGGGGAGGGAGEPAMTSIGGFLRARDIHVDAGPAGVTLVTGLIDASCGAGVGAGVGGRVVVTGQRVVLLGRVDASGLLGGGEVLLGGEQAGAQTAGVRPAWITYVGADSVVRADALTSGPGGRVIVWSDYITGFYGKISVLGAGAVVGGGRGGFVETSGKEGLDSSGQVDAGAGGVWLLDPRSVTISTALIAGGAFSGGNPRTFTPTADNANVRASDILASINAGTSVIITTGATGAQAGSISVNAPLTLSAGAPGSLTLRAAGDIILNASLTAATGGWNVTLSANDQTPGPDPSPTAGNVLLSAGVSINLSGGALTVSGVSFSTQTTGAITAGSVTANMTGDIQVNGDIRATSGAITLNAGTDGTGNLTFATAGVDLNAATIVLRAGDGTGGGGTGATVNVIGNSPIFRAASPGAALPPTNFTIRQDAAITDAQIPTLAAFGGGFTPGTYTLRSDDATVTASTAGKIAGASVSLIASSGVVMAAPMGNGSLTISADSDGDGAGTASITAALTLGNFSSSGAAFSNTGSISSVNGLTISHSGTVSIGADLEAIEGVVTVQGSSVALAATLSANNGVVLNSAGAVTQTAGAIIGARLRFNAGAGFTLTSPLNDVDLIAGSAGGAVTYVDADSVGIDSVLGASGLASTGAGVSIQILLDGASVSINQPLSALTTVILDAPAGGQSGLSGNIVGAALLLRGAGVTASWGLQGTVATFASSANGPITYVNSGASSFSIGSVAGTAGITNTGSDVVITSGGTLTISAPINLGDGRLLLGGAGAITQTAAGAISVGALGFQNTSTVTLTAASNNTVSFAAVGPTSVSYADAGDVNISAVIGVSGVNCASLQMAAQGAIQVRSLIVTTGSTSLSAGSDGTGNFSFGLAGLSIRASSIALRAGNGPGGGGGAAVDVITNAPVFRGAAGGATSPGSFSLRQDAAIADVAIPGVGQFGIGITGMTYALASDDGGLTIQTAAKVAGAGLQLSGAPALVNVSIAPQSLSVLTAAVLNGSVTATGPVSFAGAVTLNTSVTIAGSSVTFSSTVDGNSPGLRSLTINSTGATQIQGAVGGASALLNVTTNAGGSLAFSAGVTTTGNQAYGEAAVSLTGSATLNAGPSGAITFAPGSALAAGANQLSLRASDISLPGSLSGAGVLTIEPGSASQGVNIAGAPATPALDLTAAALAGIQNGFSQIVIGRADGTGLVAVNGAVAFNDAVTFRSGGPSGTVQVNGLLQNLVGGGFTFVAPGGITLSAGVNTQSGPVVMSDRVIVGASVTINTTVGGGAGGAVSFASTVDAAGPGVDLTVSGGGALTTIAGAVGATTPLRAITLGRASLAGGATTTGAQTYASLLLANPSGSTLNLSAAGAAPVVITGRVDASVLGQQSLQIAAGSITLSGPVGGLTALGSFAASGPVTFAAAGGVSATSAAGGSGDITAIGVVTLTGSGVVTFTSAGGRTRLGTVDSAVSGQTGLVVNGGLTLGQVGVASPLGSVAVNGSAIVGPGSVVTRSGAGQSGSQAWAGPVSLAGSARFEARGAGLSFGAALSAGAASLTLQASDLQFSGPVTGAGAVAIEPGTPSGAVLIGGADGPGGALDLAPATLARLANGFSSITIGRSDGSGVLTVASATTFADPLILQAPVAPGAILVNAPLIGVDNATITLIGSGSTVVLNADVRTSGQAITFSDRVVIAAALVTIDSTGNGAAPLGAAVTFGPGFAVDSEAGEQNSLTVRAGTTGQTTFGGAVGAGVNARLGALATDAGGVTLLGPLVVAENQSYGDAIQLGDASTLIGQGIAFASTINGAGDGGQLTVQSLGGPANVIFSLAVGGATPLQSVLIEAQVTATINGGSIRTSGDQIYEGLVSLGANTVLNGANVRLQGGVLGGLRSLTVTASAVTEFGGVVQALGSVTTNAGGSTLISTASFTATTSAVFGDQVQIGAPTTIRVSNGPMTFAAGLNTGAFDTTLVATEIDFLAAVTGTGRLNLRQADLAQDVNIADTTEAGGPGLDITAAELDFFGDGFSNVEFGDEGGGGTLTVQTYVFATGVTFVMAGAGGQTQVAGDIATDGDGDEIGIRGTGSTTHIFGNITTRGGAITIDDSIVIENPSVTIDSTGAGQRPGALVNVTRLIDSAALEENTLIIRSGAGVASLAGAIGSRVNGRLGALTINATGGINLSAPSVRTRGAQSYAGPVTLGPSVTLTTIAAPITFNGAVNGSANLTIGAGSGATTFNGGVGGATVLASLTINAGSTRIFNSPVTAQVLTIFGGTVEFNALTRVTTGLLISGSLGGTGEVTFDLPLTWVGGSMVGTGTTNIGPSGALVISGGPKTLSRRIENFGAVYWTDGDLDFAGGAFINHQGGQFFAQSDGAFRGVSGANSFANLGAIERSGVGSASFTGMTFSSPGTISILSADLTVAPSTGLFTLSGQVTIAAGSTLIVTGDFTMTPTARLDTAIGGPQLFGRVSVSGVATLAGTLGATFVDRFDPPTGSRFDVVTGAAVIGQFSTTLLPVLPGRVVTVQYGQNFASVVVLSGTDFNGDGVVDPDDLSDFISGFFSQPADIRTDFNGDGVVDPDDLSDFISAFFG